MSFQNLESKFFRETDFFSFFVITTSSTCCYFLSCFCFCFCIECRNCGRFISKYFVKLMHLSLNAISQNIFHGTQCEKIQSLLSTKNISSNQLLSIIMVKALFSRNFCPNSVRVCFVNFLSENSVKSTLSLMILIVIDFTHYK